MKSAWHFLRQNRTVAFLLAMAAILAVTTVAVTTGFASNKANPQVAPPFPAVLTLIRGKALEWSGQNGEFNPTNGVVVGTARNTFYHGNVDSDQPVYVVQLEGQFIGNRFPTPPGQPLRQGSPMILVYDAQTLDMTDWEIEQAPQDLTTFGQTVPLG